MFLGCPKLVQCEVQFRRVCVLPCQRVVSTRPSLEILSKMPVVAHGRHIEFCPRHASPRGRVVNFCSESTLKVFNAFKGHAARGAQGRPLCARSAARWAQGRLLLAGGAQRDGHRVARCAPGQRREGRRVARRWPARGRGRGAGRRARLRARRRPDRGVRAESLPMVKEPTQCVYSQLDINM